jgi:hypothetical protein
MSERGLYPKLLDLKTSNRNQPQAQAIELGQQILQNSIVKSAGQGGIDRLLIAASMERVS